MGECLDFLAQRLMPPCDDFMFADGNLP